jgi:Rod binding domain-containing protein
MIPAITTTLSATQVQQAWKAAQNFEAMTLNEFLKPMFDTVDLSRSPLGGGEGEAQWKPMMIDALAKQITAAGGIGLAQPVFTQMIHMQEAKDSHS